MSSAITATEYRIFLQQDLMSFIERSFPRALANRCSRPVYPIPSMLRFLNSEQLRCFGHFFTLQFGNRCRGLGE
jgi:hypothetical protein